MLGRLLPGSSCKHDQRISSDVVMELHPHCEIDAHRSTLASLCSPPWGFISVPGVESHAVIQKVEKEGTPSESELTGCRVTISVMFSHRLVPGLQPKHQSANNKILGTS
ncbi:hypothetical protein MLD38_007191 [Melastoma candidum]|uniref:Uncharacterized protein n=1 Tax=Melastoma candidum TaxID=119954 RepID=A0ACB9RUK1_9MYRT|nr:hypothetical protein MLD38_007191 [Melastoma candidum]